MGKPAVPVVILSALASRAMPVCGRGESVRDWLCVADHAEALQAREGVG